MRTFKGLFGSRLYGTDTALSDTDYVEVFYPSALDMLEGFKDVESFQTSPGVKNTAEDVDVRVMSSFYVADKLMADDLYVYDMLFAPYGWFNDVLFNELQLNRHYLSPSSDAKFRAYVKQQVRMYDPRKKSTLEYFVNDPVAFVEYNKTSDKEFLLEGKVYQVSQVNVALKAAKTQLENWGVVDLKTLSHAYRAMCFARNFSNWDYKTYPLTEREKQVMKSLKLGETDKVEEVFSDLHQYLDTPEVSYNTEHKKQMLATWMTSYVRY